MSSGPLRHVLSFWKPLADVRELERLAQYKEPGGRLSHGLHALRAHGEARHYRVTYQNTESLLFAAVHPMEHPPKDAEVLAEIRELSGELVSFVLWYPGQECAVVPFDPSAAIEALWMERYMPPSRRTVLPGPVLSAYYALRPLIPASAKQMLRRLVARKSDASAHYLFWPLDRSLDVLMQLMLHVAMKVLGRNSLSFMWFWPDGHPWAAILTHDVETAQGLARVPHVMDIEKDKGLRSSFNLVPQDYEISGTLLEQIQEEGFEVGVHGYTHDGLMFARWTTFLERVIKVNECGRRWKAAGFRSPATYRNLDWFHLLGFEYDSSVTDTAPFEPQPGGCGSLFPYMVGDVAEVPMTVPQDHTLFSLLGETDARVWIEKLAAIRDAGGMACVLTHPDPGEGYIGRRHNEQCYRDVLNFVAESDAWTPLPRDLARWWRARSEAMPGQSSAPAGTSLGTASLDADGRLVVAPPAASEKPAAHPVEHDQLGQLA